MNSRYEESLGLTSISKTTIDAALTAPWRDGGPDGLAISRDTLTFSREKFGDGTYEIYVEDGIASDTVGLRATDSEGLLGVDEVEISVLNPSS